MSWNVGAKGRQGACTFAPSRWPPWLRDGRRGAGAAAAGELEKKQAAAAGELGKKQAPARGRAREEERVGRRRRMPARENGRASDWAGTFPSLQQIARGRQVISHRPADCAPPCWVAVTCQMSNCGKRKTRNF
jgi:hypothetical protein